MPTAGTFPYPPDDPERVQQLAARCRSLAARCAGAADALTRDELVPPRSWVGPAAAACRAELQRAARLARRVADPLRDASVALGRFRSALIRAREGIDRVRADYDEELARQRTEMAR